MGIGLHEMYDRVSSSDSHEVLRERGRARIERGDAIVEALRDVQLSSFTVGDLTSLLAVLGFENEMESPARDSDMDLMEARIAELGLGKSQGAVLGNGRTVIEFPGAPVGGPSEG